MLTSMDTKKLSAVIEKNIRLLCLKDFPCGGGSWRTSQDSAETEETDSALDLLNCPRSPWRHDETWSPQVPALRRLAVLNPERLSTNFIYKCFTTLRIVNKDVTAIDRGLLEFFKLEELVLSVNKISEIPAENLPSTLKILEVRANRLSSLNALTSHPPPRLRHLGLGSNALGSHEDAARLTGRHWPQLVCLDLSDCEFQDQQTLLNALCTLPCLRTLVLEGNPLTLVSSYPGFTVDSLPQLHFLDAAQIYPEERFCFRGLADMRGLIVDQASVKVSVGRMGGIPDPTMSVDKNSPDFPVVTFSFYVTYKFLSQQTPVDPVMKVDSEPSVETPATARVMGDSCSDGDLLSNNECERQTFRSETGVANAKENRHDADQDVYQVSSHSTSKLAWSECMDFSDTQVYTITDLKGLKKFFTEGVHLSIEEEKVLSWPAAPEEKKSAKGKDSSIKFDSAKDKSKDKKKKCELVQDAPIRRILASVHVPLQSLLKGSQKATILCDLDALHKEHKDSGKKTKDEDRDSKLGRRSGARQKNTASAIGKGKKPHGTDVLADSSMSVPPKQLAVEFSVELEKWQSVSEAQRHLLQHY